MEDMIRIELITDEGIKDIYTEKGTKLYKQMPKSMNKMKQNGKNYVRNKIFSKILLTICLLYVILNEKQTSHSW